MLLLIDAGNTRIKWALAAQGRAAPGTWLESGILERQALPQLDAPWRGKPLSGVWLSNVAGDAVQRELSRLLPTAAQGQAPALQVFRSAACIAGLRNAYRNPAQLGSDRFASAIGARALHPGQPLIVATCGTATTVDAVSADGVFLGGMILPGLRLMAQSLATHTAQLPDVAQRMGPSQPFADNTEEAIVLGCLSAQAGAIERAMNRLPGARCIISGGAAGMVAPYLGVPPIVVENLVLVGLHVAAMENQA